MVEYNYKEAEQKWLVFWEKEKIYKFNPGRKVYGIDTPPPTLSGDMHIGHAFSYSQQDFIARFHRMKDGSVFYPFGTDDNGLPTERLVEKLKNVRSKEMSRADFIELCLKTLKEIRPEFIQGWKNLGISCDYDIYYSTIDDASRKLSQKYFIELFKKGLAYKKDFPSIWCPLCQTAIAQAELEDKEFPSQFSTLVFKSGKEELLISTTRPELLQACVAVFVHSKDKRYKKFVGKKVKVPIFDFEVPVISDDSADIEKGTGVMMVCSYGDKYDVEAVAKHKLKPKIIFNKNGTLNYGIYKGMKIKEARKRILEDLEKKNFVRDKKQISHSVNVHDKCGTEIEFIPTEQWFIKILDKKKIWIDQGKKMKWHPEFMLKRYENWVNGLDWDWNISRDRHFGVPIPVWYCKKCKEIIAAEEKELPVDPLKKKKKCSKCNEDCVPEEKVLDTWATSSLTPQIISYLSNGKVKVPFSLRPQAHDIIRTWTFYTIVRSYLHENEIPWENVALSGYVKLKGEKMSKSKGNVIDPKQIIGQYGADALRFGAASSKLGEDVDYQEKDLVAGKKFVNKLLNASKFVFMNLEGYDYKKPKKIEMDDIEFLGKLNKVIEKSTESFENYEYLKAKLEIEEFFWKYFCDFYLETVKKVLYQESGDKKLSVQYTLYKSLLTVLKLIAPIMPFVTEEIYQTYYRKNESDKSIHISNWPEAGDEKYKGDLEILKDNLSKINKFKSENNLSLNAPIDQVVLVSSDYKVIKNYEERFSTVSGAALFSSGKEFKIEKSSKAKENHAKK
ncbi:MAG: valine--tRNA ligase [Nanoarchaeota archaeon]